MTCDLSRSKFWQHRVPRRPLVWWYVMGRKNFEFTFGARRRAWQCGDYHHQSVKGTGTHD
jgi:hypothetical protein